MERRMPIRLTGMKTLLPAAALLLMTAAPPALAQATACKIEPVAKTRTLPPYPSDSLQAKETGTVLLRVTLARDGHATAAQVARSSGFPRLDRAAVEHVRQHYLWQPTACASTQTNVRVVFNIADGPQ